MLTLNAKTGVVLDPKEFEALDIGEGLVIQNEGASRTQSGRVAVVFLNTDEYGGDDLVVTPSVTAKLTESGSQLDAVPAEITIPPNHCWVIGPFGLENQNGEAEIEFTLEGQEGSYYAFYTR